VCDLYPGLGNQNFELLESDAELFKINDLQLSSKTMYVLFGPVFMLMEWRNGRALINNRKGFCKLSQDS
jgi:hypothetical protein